MVRHGIILMQQSEAECGRRLDILFFDASVENESSGNGDMLSSDLSWMVDEECRSGKVDKAASTMIGPKYKKGDVVKFNFDSDKPPYEGMIAIIDPWGTFDQHEEPSYDIYKFDNNTLYKHVRQSLVTEFVRSGDLSEMDENIDKFQ